MEPDIKIEVVDRGMLYLDPYIMTGDIKDAAWVIERGIVTRDDVERQVRSGHWKIDGDMNDLSNLFAPPQDDLVRRILGLDIGNAEHRGPERDDLIEIHHYWQAERRGAPHAYGVILGGRNGTLVRWGPNPFPYKGIPYRGKSYFPDTYKPDGTSLAMQYRSIQECAGERQAKMARHQQPVRRYNTGRSRKQFQICPDERGFRSADTRPGEKAF